MAVFEAQISAQISIKMKDAIMSLARTDAELAALSEADVIRLAIETGLREISGMTPAMRVRAYGQIKRGEK